MLIGAMFAFLIKLLLVARSRLKSQASLEAENLVLRQRPVPTWSKSIAAARPAKYRGRTSSWDASPAPANFRATAGASGGKREAGSSAVDFGKFSLLQNRN